jgi:hypothetical protein
MLSAIKTSELGKTKGKTKKKLHYTSNQSVKEHSKRLYWKKKTLTVRQGTKVEKKNH